MTATRYSRDLARAAAFISTYASNISSSITEHAAWAAQVAERAAETGDLADTAHLIRTIRTEREEA